MKVFNSKNLLSNGLRLPALEAWKNTEGLERESLSALLMPQKGNVFLMVVRLVVAMGLLLGIPRIDSLDRGSMWLRRPWVAVNLMMSSIKSSCVQTGMEG